MTPVECPTCGSLVGNMEKHRRYHQETEGLTVVVNALTRILEERDSAAPRAAATA